MQNGLQDDCRPLEIGAGEKSRTPDLRITNALLYQLSYTGKAGHYSALGITQQRVKGAKSVADECG